MLWSPTPQQLSAADTVLKIYLKEKRSGNKTMSLILKNLFRSAVMSKNSCRDNLSCVFLLK